MQLFLLNVEGFLLVGNWCLKKETVKCATVNKKHSTFVLKNTLKFLTEKITAKYVELES